MPEWGEPDVNAFWVLDLRSERAARQAMAGGIQWVFALAADMGGAGFVFTGEHDLEILRNNTRINLNTLDAAWEAGVERYFFSSSACIYPQHLQCETDVMALKEEGAYPADPDSEYGWEKLYAERLCLAYGREADVEVRIGRFHNLMGAPCHWDDGREKLPAAACRKVAVAKLAGDPRVEIWGDGKQTRSFCHIDDGIEMIVRLMLSDYIQPLNIGTSRLASVNEVFDIVAGIAGISIEKVYVPGPEGVRGRNADLALMHEVLDYEPQVSLEGGLARIYRWIEKRVREKGA